MFLFPVAVPYAQAMRDADVWQHAIALYVNHCRGHTRAGNNASRGCP